MLICTITLVTVHKNYIVVQITEFEGTLYCEYIYAVCCIYCAVNIVFGVLTT